MIFDTRPYAELRLKSETFTNPRSTSGLSTDEIRELAIHIGRNGLQVPLRVTPDGTITAGQRRYLAISLLLHWRDTLADEIHPDDHEIFDLRALELREGVPFVLDEEEDSDQMVLAAIADNVARADMTHYEIAQQVIPLSERGLSHRAIADGIGKSRGYVGKMIAAWRGCSPELMTAWREDKIAYERVKELADLSHVYQRDLLAMPKPEPEGRRPSSRGGPHGRPGIEVLKMSLKRAAKRMVCRGPDDPSLEYMAGLVAALRVATGEISIESIPALVEPT